MFGIGKKKELKDDKGLYNPVSGEVIELSKVKDGTLKPDNGTEFVPQDFIGYDFSKEETASYYENGEKIQTEEMFTDKKGYLCSPELPYGKYVCIESTVPENMEEIQPFLVTIDEDSREPQVWRVFNDRPMQFYFKIITSFFSINRHYYII